MINWLASAIGLVALVGMVSIAAEIVSDVQHIWVTTIIGNVIAVPAAIAAWSGAMWKDSKHEIHAPRTWRDWIGVFFAATALSVAFVAIDVAIVHPGLSLTFTVAALALSFIALPSALRAWILERLSRRRSEPDN